ncbi:redoxin domain-containing protein [Thiomicrorhabdus indica]|uniref:redoxin domain-containing protein n=1 Tax=Thiomicrorhabdus indica TaxID=2267253 RepID=UPI002AA7E1F7|nr:redoxin domain-containing protein [Thiomicrorhabdus indica]
MSDSQNTTESKPSPPSFWQKSWVKNLLTVMVFFAIYLALRPFFQGDVIEGKAPEMRLESITGESIDLQAINAQGEPVLIHIWATWCPICKFTSDNVESIANDYTVISIATQSGDNQAILDYAEQNQLTPNFIVNDFDGKWMQAFGARAVPADFIVNAKGEIEFIEVGFSSELGLRLRLWWSSLTNSAPTTQEVTP